MDKVFKKQNEIKGGELLLTFEDIADELLLSFEEVKLIEDRLYDKPTDSNCMGLYQKFSKVQCPFLYKYQDYYKCFWHKLETDRCRECYEKYPRKKE